MLDGTPVTVIGVMPASFDFAGLFTPGSRIDLFVPFPLSPEKNRQGNTLALIGRLKPGVTIETAQSEAKVIADRIRAPGRNGFRPRLSPLHERVSGKFRSAAFVLAAAVGFVMLIVCVNLSNLLLARASARQKEMAVRAALGAGRGRLIRQMLIESLTLSGCGSALGLALAATASTLLARLEWTSVPLLQHVRLDAPALAFTLLVTVVTGVLFGIAPALRVSAYAPYSALKESSRGSTGARRPRLDTRLARRLRSGACLRDVDRRGSIAAQPDSRPPRGYGVRIGECTRGTGRPRARREEDQHLL